MSELTAAERACLNMRIAEIVKEWSSLRDGDLVAMVTRINGIVALSLSSQRGQNRPITAA